MNEFAKFKKPKQFIEKKLDYFSPKGLLLYLLPLALIPATIIALSKGSLWLIIINASAFSAYILAAWCLRKGLQLERQFLKSRFTSTQPSSLKSIAIAITTITTGLLAWQGALQEILVALIYAGGAFLGMYLSYGFDPKHKKKIIGANGYSSQEILQVLVDSSKKIQLIEIANSNIKNLEFNQRLEHICETANCILQEIESDPHDLRKSRKFLNVYLEGARQVTEGYASTHKKSQTGELEQNFRNVLETIESVFNQQYQKLQEDDLFDLDVQIEVLNTQLKREGII